MGLMLFTESDLIVDRLEWAVVNRVFDLFASLSGFTDTINHDPTVRMASSTAEHPAPAPHPKTTSQRIATPAENVSDVTHAPIEGAYQIGDGIERPLNQGGNR
jgi:hypothetical protein